MANELEHQLGTILNDPAMMQKIMTVAKSLSNPPAETPTKDPCLNNDVDIALLQKLSGLVTQNGIDQHQKSLLAALSPFLSKVRIQKLETAMRAAQMAKLASSIISPPKSGR